MLTRPSAKRLSAGLAMLLCSLPILADEGNEALLHRYAEAWNSGDPAALDSIVSDDFVRHGGYGSAGSRDELKKLVSNLHAFYGDLRIEVDDSFAGPRKGAMRWRFSGRFGDASFDMNSLNFSMFHFTDGRISQEWVHGNTVDFWQSMGYRIMPPGTRMVPPEIEDPPDLAPRAPPEFGVERLTAYAEKTLQQEPGGTGRLEITSAVDCRLSLDRRALGGLEAGRPVVLRLGSGQHVLQATSLGGSPFFRQAVEVNEGQVASVEIQAPARALIHLRARATEDLTSGLMWQMTDNGDNITKTGAEAYCNTLDQGGYEDWRLPTIHELLEIYSPEAAATKRFHTIDGIELTGCCPWTTSPHGDFYWTILFYNGLRYIKHDSIGKFSRALCVREAA